MNPSKVFATGDELESEVSRSTPLNIEIPKLEDEYKLLIDIYSPDVPEHSVRGVVALPSILKMLMRSAALNDQQKNAVIETLKIQHESQVFNANRLKRKRLEETIEAENARILKQALALGLPVSREPTPSSPSSQHRSSQSSSPPQTTPPQSCPCYNPGPFEGRCAFHGCIVPALSSLPAQPTPTTATATATTTTTTTPPDSTTTATPTTRRRVLGLF